MPGDQRKCDCGAVILSTGKPGRPSKKCPACRTPATVREIGSARSASTPSTDGPTLEEVTREELAEAGRDRSRQGVLALQLARRLDGSATATGSALAALTAAFTKAMDAALADAKPVGDVIDAIFGAG